MSREQHPTWTHLKDLNEGHNFANEILDLADIVVGLKHPGRKAPVELRLDSIGEVMQGPGRS